MAHNDGPKLSNRTFARGATFHPDNVSKQENNSSDDRNQNKG